MLGRTLWEHTANSSSNNDQAAFKAAFLLYSISGKPIRHNRNMKNKDFTKFTKRNTHRRREKDAARRELMRCVNQVESSYTDFKIHDSNDAGRRSAEKEYRPHKELHARGIFSSSRSGFGFVKTEGSDRDIFIPERKTMGAVDGDIVEISYHSFKGYNNEEKTEGRVIKIAEYGRQFIIGTLDEEIYRHGRRRYHSFIIIPDDPKLNITPYVTDTQGAQVGEKVIARLIRRGAGLECAVTRLLGHTESRKANYSAILAECGIETEFSKEEAEDAERLSRIPLSDEGRIRFDDIIFTIDGESAKDLDDAVSVKRTEYGYRLGVHIADVSEYVTERTPLDRCAMARGTSVYFVDKVVPMLPPALSNGACSLNSGEEKYALSAVIDLDVKGEIIGTEIYKSIIKSRVRGVYSEINNLLAGNADGQIQEKYKELLPSLKLMEELYLILLKKREAAGYIDFDTDDAVIILSEDGMPSEILRRERGVSERIIEHFMLTANEAVATLLRSKEIPCVYRIHEKPPEDKLREFLNFVHNLGFDANVINANNVSPRTLQRLLSLAEERGCFPQVSRAMLRSMSKAKYSSVQSPHFGLGMEMYCHFTSPIRRLSDLATHRIIKRVLCDGKRKESYSSYAGRAAAAATDAEMRAEEAERRIENLYKALYMAEHLGEQFDAVISSVTSFGLFCETENTCEGLVPLSEMPGEFIFDEKSLTLRSRDVSYSIADRVTVLLEEVDIIRGKIRFSIAEK